MRHPAQASQTRQETGHKRRTTRPVRRRPAKQMTATDLAQLQRAAQDPAHARPADILGLQRTAGNRAVGRLIQAKLTVGPVGDRYEQEADRAAEQVMSGKPHAVQRQGEGEVQTKRASADGSFEAGGAFESRLSGTRGGGSPLPDAVRRQMERGLGADFSGVRVHTGGEASRLNRSISAQAFTHGQDIYLGEGRYDPGTSAGNRLLAHELTHVVQQTGGGAQRPVQRDAGPIIQRDVMTPEEWMSRSRLGALHTRSSALTRIDKAVAEYRRVKSRENLIAIQTAITAWQNTKGARISERQDAVDELLAQVIDATQRLPPPTTANLTNVPLTWTDMLEARKEIYLAGVDALTQLAASTGAERRVTAMNLAVNLRREGAQTAHPEDKALLEELANATKRSKRELGRVFDKHTIEQIAGRIAAELQLDPEQTGRIVNACLITRLNAQERWRTYVQYLDIGGAAYASKFVPVNREFDPTFAERGTGGYASATTSLTEHEMPMADKARATNVWYTQFAKGDPAQAPDDVIFAAFRSGAVSEKHIHDSQARRVLAHQKAYDLLKGMVVQYVHSREGAEQQEILAGRKVPTIPIVSTALLTGIPIIGHLPGLAFDRVILKEHAAVLETFHDRPTLFSIVWDNNQQKRVTVKFDIINFNKAVNEMRMTGGSLGQQVMMNRRAMDRLEKLKSDGLALLSQKLINNSEKLRALPANDPTYAAMQQRVTDLRVQMAKIEQLWIHIQKMKGVSHSGSRYELPALVSNLAYQLGAMVHYNCMSGKDRTGMADVEAKLLALQMDKRAKEWVESGFNQAKAELVPKYEQDLNEEEGEAALKLIFEGGNLNIQKMNTALAGYKVRGAMKGTVVTGRLEHILATERARTLLRQYMQTDDPLAGNAKQLSKMLQGLSFLTEA